MLGPFSHYLQSNQGPSEDEAREIKALRTYPLEKISIIDVEIGRIDEILNSLKQERARIQKSIDDCNTVLAPVRRLSTDVLGIIFSYCLATHRNPIMSASEAPILLTQICHDWRSVAFSTPRLWSRLYIPPLYGTSCVGQEHRMEARSEEVQRWLRLSATCPLSITMMPAGVSIAYPPLFDAIIQSSRRWQELELGYLSPDSDVSNKLLSLSADDLCMLRELRIHSLQRLTTNTDMEDLWYQSGLLTAQGLRRISISDIYQTNTFPASIIPQTWKNLDHLFIHSPILLGFALQILSCCSNLGACLLEIFRRSWDSDIETIPNTTSTTLPSFPHLKFLSLHGDFTCCNLLFRNIKAPSLQILDYQGIFYEEFGLRDFLQSVNSLKTLRLDYHNLTGSNASKYYSLVPSVTHLVVAQSPERFHYSNSGHGTLSTLYEIKHQYSPDSTPTVLFPSLEVFEAYGISDVTDTIFLEFIMARVDATRSNTGVSKLRKVLVEFSRTREIDIVPEALDYARAAGIEFELNLTYYTGKEVNYWSPSFGLSMNDVSWIYPLYNY